MFFDLKKEIDWSVRIETILFETLPMDLFDCSDGYLITYGQQVVSSFTELVVFKGYDWSL